jgi:hypothetical protein
MILEFGEWMPDLPDLGNPGALTATNVVPDRLSYRPLPGLAVQSDALGARPLGIFSANDASANTFVYAGDATKLYELVDLSWTDESGATYATAAADVWEFAQFGTTAGAVSVNATNFTDPVQTLAVGGGGGGAFADLITSTLKPKAKHIGVWRDFLVLGNTSDGTDGHVPNRVWWSAINDATDFDPDAATQSDFQTFPDGGWVQKIVEGVEYGLVFQERTIRRATYVGAPLIFDFDAIDRRRGTPIPNSVINHGRLTFFISEEGFFVNDGVTSHPIGAGKVDRTFWNQFDIGNKTAVSVGIDPLNKLVMWSFPGSGATDDQPNKVFLYSWQWNRWAEADLMVLAILQTATQGYTLDGLDAIGTDIDDSVVFAESFDSDAWKGGKLRLAAIDTDFKLNYFTGANLAAVIDTKEGQIFGGKKAFINGFRPLIDGGTVTGSLGGRDAQTDAVVFGPETSINTDGECRVRGRNRYHRARINIAAGGTWTHAQGVEIEPGRHAVPGGDR